MAGVMLPPGSYFLSRIKVSCTKIIGVVLLHPNSPDIKTFFTNSTFRIIVRLHAREVPDRVLCSI